MFSMLSGLFSMQGVLGADSFSQFFSQGNGMLPVVALAAVWMLGGSLLRLTTSLLPIAVLVLFLLGSGSGQGIVQNFSHSGWLPIALVLFVLMNMARGRLFSFQSIIAIATALYLMGARDFSIDGLLRQGKATGHFGLIVGVGALFLLIAVYRLMMRRRFYPGRAFRPLLHVDAAAVKTFVNYGAVASGIVLASLLVTNPAFIEHALPGWRSGVGVALLLASLFALGLSLPLRARVWMMPLFWSVVCITIGTELYTPQLLAPSKLPSAMEQF